MREFEQNFPDWQEQVESCIFYPRDTKEGAQFYVYTRPGIDFVVKVPKNPIWMQGYLLTEELAPEYAIPFVRVENIRLNINRVKSRVPEAVVQVKADDLLEKIGEAFQARNAQQLESLVRTHIKEDLGFFKKGLFVPDPTYNNYGINKQGKVKRFDFGDARISFTGDEEYSGLALARASSHYSIFFLLRSLGKKCGVLMQNEQEFSEFYAEQIALPPPHPRASTLDELIMQQEGQIWNSDVSMFLARVGHEEFVRHAPNGAPFKLNEDFIRNLPGSLNL